MGNPNPSPATRFKQGNKASQGRQSLSDEEKALRAAARSHADRAIARLAFWMGSDNAKASVASANALLDRGFGKPTQPISSDPENPILPVLNVFVDGNQHQPASKAGNGVKQSGD